MIGVYPKRELALFLLRTPIRYPKGSSTLESLAVLRVSGRCQEPAAETPRAAQEACGFEAKSKSHVTKLPSLRLERSGCERGHIDRNLIKVFCIELVTTIIVVARDAILFIGLRVRQMDGLD